MKKINKTQLGNYICAIMCLLVLITQFLPFWNCSNCKEHKDEDKLVSVVEYVWFPHHHTPITKGMTNVYLEAYGEDYTVEEGKKYKFDVDDIVLPCVVIFVGSIVGFALTVAFSQKTVVGAIPLFVGSVGTYWYLTCPAMKVGANWQIHLVAVALMAVVALVFIIQNIMLTFRNKK